MYYNFNLIIKFKAAALKIKFHLLLKNNERDLLPFYFQTYFITKNNIHLYFYMF